jgi:hypothetical protein
MNSPLAYAIVAGLAFSVAVGNIVHITTAAQKRDTVPQKALPSDKSNNICVAFIGCNNK